MISSRYGLYSGQYMYYNGIYSYSFLIKFFFSSNYFLKLENIKKKLIVIAKYYVAMKL